MSLRRRDLLVAALAAPCGVRARAALPSEVASELPGARLQGSGRFSFIGLHVYDARLWVMPDFDIARVDQQPLALELHYARALEGERIAQRSLEEMNRQQTVDAGAAQRWLEQMRQTFPDVRKGDRITGVQRPGESSRFFANGAFRGEIRDAEFTRRFFAIWLAPYTSAPALREALLGTPRPAS